LGAQDTQAWVTERDPLSAVVPAACDAIDENLTNSALVAIARKGDTEMLESIARVVFEILGFEDIFYERLQLAVVALCPLLDVVGVTSVC